jgi:hypothetical protein
MTRKTLRHILEPAPDDGCGLRWRAAVPIATNPFLLLELFQFAFAGAAVVLVILCVGVRLTDGGLTPADIRISLQAAGLILLTSMAVVIGLGFLVFGNRYFAVFQLGPASIYYEASRGHDDDRRPFLLSVRPVPVRGQVVAGRTRSRQLAWDRISHFEDYPSLGVIVLRRRRWHMLKLYTPDPETHRQVVRCLEERLARA